ncbi:MAG: hypothetical protein IPN34_10790 [Planctomycetes bacterium]|nr:hypothetical protein [Planctomycetota bacterium]
MIRSRHLLAATALALALGLSATPATAQRFLPIEGKFTTSFVLTPTATPGVFSLSIDSQGIASHLGLTVGSSTHTVDMTGTPTVQFGSTTYIAANGDRLFAHYSGTASAPNASGVITFSGTQTFTGGTGRFHGATGSTSMQGTANLATSTGEFAFSGTISK